MTPTKSVITLLLAASGLMAQAVAPSLTPTALVSLPTTLQQVTLPTYVGGGLTYDQQGGVKGFVFGATPVSSAVGVYAGTAADLLPFHYIDAATGKTVYSVQTQLRGELFKTLYTGPKWQLLLGVEAGGAFTTQASSVNVSIATGATAMVAYQINAHFGIIAPIRALWSAAAGPAGGWVLTPGIGVVWKP